MAAGALAGVAASVVGLTTAGGTPAFASWRSSPSPISAADASALGAPCRAARAVTPDGTVPWPMAGAPVIVGRRGHSAYAVYSVGERWIDCLATRRSRNVRRTVNHFDVTDEDRAGA